MISIDIFLCLDIALFFPDPDLCGQKVHDPDLCGQKVPDPDLCGQKVPDPDLCGQKVPDPDPQYCFKV